VTSADFRDGKTTVAISLASCLAHDFDAQVVLVDADFETHSIAREYGLQDRPGLSDVLAGTTDLPAVAHRFRRAPLTVITAGSRQADAARMARSQELVGLLDNLKRMSGFVVMDLPATLRSMNTPVLASRCDGVIVVVRAGRTSRRDLERTLELLQDANIIGVVVNRQHSNVPGWVDRLLALPR
jgi:Mrp family chromosome partitioning ATPase